MSQSIYTLGETVTASSWCIANPGVESVAVEGKSWIVRPNGDTIPEVRLGADGSFVLSSGFDMDIGPRALFTVGPGTDTGSYEFNCRLLDPVTGETIMLVQNFFDVQ